MQKQGERTKKITPNQQSQRSPPLSRSRLVFHIAVIVITAVIRYHISSIQFDPFFGFCTAQGPQMRRKGLEELILRVDSSTFCAKISRQPAGWNIDEPC